MCPTFNGTLLSLYSTIVRYVLTLPDQFIQNVMKSISYIRVYINLNHSSLPVNEQLLYSIYKISVSDKLYPINIVRHKRKINMIQPQRMSN